MKDAHGPQGWWPVFKTGAGPDAQPVYDPARKKRTSRQRFEIAVGAILTQNTAWTNVTKALGKLHRRGLLTPQSIRRIPRGRLARLIRSSGYYNQKAIKLKSFVEFLDRVDSVSDPFRRLRRLPPLQARELLLTVRGIGPETADSIVLYALEKPVFVIDAYTRRIFSRHRLIRGDEPYEDIRKMFETNLPRSVTLWNDYHAQIVDVGKRYCRRQQPECRGCPLGRWDGRGNA